MTTIKIPTPLRAYTNGSAEIEVKGETVGAALTDLVSQHPDLRAHLYNGDQLRNFVNVFIGEEDIRYRDGLETPLEAADNLRIIPSIAGGSSVAIEQIDPATVTLSHEEIRRYSRHLIMPEVGIAGQRKLKAASVLLVGTGGLGSPLALYLTAAGVGRIGLVDYDVVDETNLQRQVIHYTSDVGKLKLDSAAAKLSDINPHLIIEKHNTPLTSENALDILEDYDVIIDGTDNFPTRYLVNDACVILGKPNVYGSIFRFEGQLSVFYAKEGPCYRCLFPEPPPPGLVPSCAEGGVLGILPGTIGTLQATEAIKLILGIGEPMIGRLLLYDALNMSFDQIKLRKNPKCPVCGVHPTITELIDYEDFCGVPAHDRSEYKEKNALHQVRSINVHDLKARLDAGDDIVVLDVREPHEWEISTIEGSMRIPKGQVVARQNEIPRDKEVIVQCKTGIRSRDSILMLKNHGFTNLVNLTGGINAWAREIDRSQPVY
jgi:molybdopterin/thiamine biosynthesis adenylyltransferase/rhodanese-related sulfurtransferase/molybdopterin converting factor small subunit